MPGLLSAVTGPAALPLLTLADAKADLGITGSGSDAQLTTIIAAATASIETHCGRVFGVQTVDETFRPGPSNGRARGAQHPSPLVLTLAPVSAVVSVTQDGTALTGGAWEADGAAGLLWRLAGATRQPWAGNVIVVRYTSGFAAVPAAVDAVMRTLTRAAWHSADRDTTVQREEVEGVGSTTYFSRASAAPYQIDTGSAALLAPYRL